MWEGPGGLALLLVCSACAAPSEDASPDAGDVQVDPGEGSDDADGDRPGARNDDAGEDPGGSEEDEGDEEIVYGPFRDLQLVGALSAPGYDDDDPSLTGDRLEIYFDSDRPGGVGGGDIYVSTRLTKSSPWGRPKLVSGINTESRETAPEISPNGHTLYFSSTRPGGAGGQDIYVSRRESRYDPWSPPVRLARLNSAANEYSPVLDGTRSRLIFVSDRDGGDNDLYQSVRLGNGKGWADPVPLNALNTPESEADPYLSRDGLTLYLAAGSAGVLDLYRAERPDLESDFAEAKPIIDVNTGSHDADPWLSKSQSLLFMTSNRSGDNEIYQTHRAIVSAEPDP